MTRIVSCLISFATTSCLSVGIHYLLPTKSTPSLAVDEAQLIGIPSVPSVVPNPPLKERSSVAASHISQEGIVHFPEIGAVHVSAHQDFGSGLRLTFRDQRSGEELLTAYFGSSNWNWSTDSTSAERNPTLRFKTISVKGLPNPLVIGIAMNPAVSDSGWEAATIGVVNGQLERLTYETLESSNQGGFFFGDLGHGIGLGAAQWDFVWGEDEGHYGPHKYEVKLFKWNGRRFEWEKAFRTRKEYEYGEDALRANGYHFVDVKALFPDWPGLDSP